MSPLNVVMNLSPHEDGNSDLASVSKSIEGKLVSLTGNHLVLMDVEHHKHSLSLDKGVQFTSSGVLCDWDELKIGSLVRATTQKQNAKLVSSVDILNTAANSRVPSAFKG